MFVFIKAKNRSASATKPVCNVTTTSLPVWQLCVYTQRCLAVTAGLCHHTDFAMLAHIFQSHRVTLAAYQL